MKRLLALCLLIVAGAAACNQAPAKEPATRPATQPTQLHVGLRRSSYGGKHTGDTAWWIERAKEFAAHFPGARPTLVEIVSIYQDDGSTRFEFARPDGCDPMPGVAFSPEKKFHEQALDEYDRQGIAVVLQVEPGNANLSSCLRIVHEKFGQHPCVIGVGVDAEWFFTKESPRHDGRPITDDEAKNLVQTVLALNPRYTLFLKHYSVKHMPPTYRHPALYFISDSNQFESAREMLADFKAWAGHFKGSDTGYQFGYAEDRKWWSTLQNPPLELSDRIRTDCPSCRYLFWVDFTANQVRFK